MTAPEGQDTAEQQRLPLDRAEEIVDELLQRAKVLAERGFALAAEEAEDIWAEAKALRRHDEC